MDSPVRTKPIFVRRKDNPLKVYVATRIVQGVIDVDDPGTQILVPLGWWALWAIGTNCHGYEFSVSDEDMRRQFEIATEAGDEKGI